MVGVPRSTGCATCVKRRIKVCVLWPVMTISLTSLQCDQRLPGCARCETYGKPCPGYDKGFKFIAGKPYRTRRPRASTDSDSSNEKPTQSRAQAAALPNQAVIRSENPASLISAGTNVRQGLSALIHDFCGPRSPSQTYVISHWFRYLPSVYGESRTLDATIETFVAHHFGRILQNGQMVAYARSTYGEALRRLRRSLANTSECLSTNIFCAVVLLCLYEVRRPSMGC